MKYYIFILAIIGTISVKGQKLSLGWSYQNLKVGDDDFFGNNTNDRSTYKIFSPLKLHIRIDPIEHFYWNNALAVNREQLVRYNNFDHHTHSLSEKPTSEYRWNMVEASSLIGYQKKVGRMLIGGDLGWRLSRIYSFTTVYNSWIQFNGQTSIKFFSIRDVNLNLEFGAGIGYELSPRLRLQSRMSVLRNFYTTEHLIDIYWLYNDHPSHGQRYLYGLEIGFYYTLL